VTAPVSLTTAAAVEELVSELAERVAEKVLAAMAGTSEAAPEWRLLSAAQAGELLGRSARWVYAASEVGGRGYLGLPFVLVGDTKRYDPESLKRWAKEREIPGELTTDSSQTAGTGMDRRLRVAQRIPDPTGRAR